MAITHKFKKGESLFSTTLSASISTGTGETITLASVTGLPTDTEITITIDRVDSNGNATPAKLERITGTISGSNLTSYTRGTDGTTEQSHSSGAVVEYIWNSQDWNDLIDGILVGHNQDGTHDPAVIYDSNGNEELKFTTTASAVNEITVTNAATGNAPEVSATGGDTNIDLKLKGKGTGQVKTYNPTDAAYEVVVGESGWIPSTYTWTYASATTFTISGVDVTSIFTKGTKLRLTQTTTKYFYVVSSSFSTNTTVTITGGSSYTFANAAVTNPYFSYSDNPRGFPGYFSYTPVASSAGGTTPTFSTTTGRFSVTSNKVRYDFHLTNSSGGTAGSGGSDFYVSIPISSTVYTSVLLGMAHIGSGATQEYNGVWVETAGTRVIFRRPNLFDTLQNDDLADANTRYVQGFVEYYI